MAFRRRSPIEDRNPFLPTPSAPPVDPTAVERDPLFGDRIVTTGPPHPLGIAADPTEAAQLPVRRLPGLPLLWVTGVHGGAGATTVTALLGSDVAEAGRCWPAPAKRTAAPSPVLLVARTHVAGLAAAAAAARTWASGQLGTLPLLGLVLVDDGPRLPKPLAAGCARAGGMVPYCWHLAWREAWREQLAPPMETLPFRVRRTVADIRARAAQARDVNTEEGTAS